MYNFSPERYWKIKGGYPVLSERKGTKGMFFECLKAIPILWHDHAASTNVLLFIQINQQMILKVCFCSFDT